MTRTRFLLNLAMQDLPRPNDFTVRVVGYERLLTKGAGSKFRPAIFGSGTSNKEPVRTETNATDN